MVAMIAIFLALATPVTGQCDKEVTVRPVAKTPRNGIQSMAQNFLDKVGTKIPFSDVHEIIEDASARRGKEALDRVWPMVQKQPGFAACFAIGILMIIFLPLAGILVAISRCLCNACGAKRQQNKPRCIELSCLAIGAIICLAFWIASIVCYVQSTKEVWPHVGTLRGGVVRQIEKTSEYVEALNGESHCVIDESMGMVRNTISEVLTSVPYMIEKLGKETIPFKQFNELFDALENSVVMQENYTKAASTLQEQADAAYKKAVNSFTRLQQQVMEWRGENQTTENAATYEKYRRIAIEEQTTLVQTLKGTIGPLKTAVSAQKDGLENRAKIADSKQKIKEAGWTAGREANLTAEQHLAAAEQKLSDALKTVDQYTSDVLAYLSKAKDTVNKVASPQKLEKYAWAKDVANVFAMPAFAIALILAIALTCGVCGCSVDKMPSERSGLSNCGGLCLIAIAYVTFLLGTLIVIVTFVLFFVGYASESLICRPLLDHPDPSYMDFITNMAKKKIPAENINFNMSVLLEECQANKGVVVAIGAKIPGFEIPEFPMKNSLSSNMDGLMEPIVRLTGDTNLLKALDVLKQVASSPTITYENLKKSSRYLATVSSLPEQPNMNKLIVDARNEYRMFDRQRKSFEDETEAVNTSVVLVNDIARDLLEKLQDIRSGKGPSEAKFNETMNNIQGDLKDGLKSVIKDVTAMVEQLGKCGSLHTIYSNTGRLLCRYIVDPVNGMWFSMGIGLFVIVPTIAFSFLLSKYCLRMGRPKEL